MLLIDHLFIKYCSFKFYWSYLRRWLLTYLFALIGSAFIDSETCPCLWLKIVHGPYLNRTYRFASPQVRGISLIWFLYDVQNCLLQVIALIGLEVSSSHLLKPSYVYFWLVCIMFIGSYLIDTETCPCVWLQNFQWDIYKPDIWIFFPHRFVECCCEGFGFCDLTCCNQCIDCIQGILSSYPSLKLCREI